jgi:hypothetical protein
MRERVCKYVTKLSKGCRREKANSMWSVCVKEKINKICDWIEGVNEAESECIKDEWNIKWPIESLIGVNSSEDFKNYKTESCDNLNQELLYWRSPVTIWQSEWLSETTRRLKVRE